MNKHETHEHEPDTELNANTEPEFTVDHRYRIY